MRVFVNPAVFGQLKERGAQVVMSHETTHVATGATFASMPTWLLEGFADFVALDHAGVPGRPRGRARSSPASARTACPTGCPTSDDLDPTANGLGATYEEAWLACRFLAQEYGANGPGALLPDRRTTGLADAAGVPQVLDTSQREFVARWRADLARLAGVAG